MQRLVTARFVCPSINSDIRKWAQTCLKWQRSKIQWRTVTPFSTFATSDAWFGHIRPDIMGPIPPSNCFAYFWRVDCFTCWLEAIPIADIMAETVANMFVARWVVQFGVPSVNTTDWGGQFKSHLWQQSVQLLRTQWNLTTAYHPIANVLVECFHRQLKVALNYQSIPERWTNLLPMMWSGVRTALKNDLHCSAIRHYLALSCQILPEFALLFVTNTPGCSWRVYRCWKTGNSMEPIFLVLTSLCHQKFILLKTVTDFNLAYFGKFAWNCWH